MGRVLRTGGGVTVYCRSKFNAEMVANLCLSFTNLEMDYFIELEHGSRKLLIGIIYQPPLSSFRVFWKNLRASIKPLITLIKSIM